MVVNTSCGLLGKGCLGSSFEQEEIAIATVVKIVKLLNCFFDKILIVLNKLIVSVESVVSIVLLVTDILSPILILPVLPSVILPVVVLNISCVSVNVLPVIVFVWINKLEPIAIWPLPPSIILPVVFLKISLVLILS